MSFLQFLKDAVEWNTFYMYDAFAMSFRAIFVYFLGVIIARSNKKIIGIRTPFNFMLFVMLGSIFANAIIMVETFLSIMVAACVLIILNYTMKTIAFHSTLVERFVKGTAVELVHDGHINWENMNSHGITKRELLNELATQAHTYTLDKIKTAILASDGTINFIYK